MASQSPVGIFEEARGRVIGEIDSIVESLNGKRAELLAEIGSLEREFLDRQREKQNDINKLNTLISHTEELGQNTLLDLQQELIHKIQQEKQKLQVDSRQEPDYSIGIKWGLLKSELIHSINSSSLELITDKTADWPLEFNKELFTDKPLSNATDVLGLAIQPDSSSDSEGSSPAPVPFTSKSKTPQKSVDTPKAEKDISILNPFLYQHHERNVITEPVYDKVPDKAHVRAAVEKSRERDCKEQKPGCKKSRRDIWD